MNNRGCITLIQKKIFVDNYNNNEYCLEICDILRFALFCIKYDNIMKSGDRARNSHTNRDKKNASYFVMFLELNMVSLKCYYLPEIIFVMKLHSLKLK